MVIEHNLDVIKTVDIIDMGPEGGDQGELSHGYSRTSPQMRKYYTGNFKGYFEASKEKTAYKYYLCYNTMLAIHNLYKNYSRHHC